MSRHKYSDIVHNLDLEAFYEAIGFLPERHENGNDIGQCPDLWGLHKHGDRTGKFAIHRDKKVFNCWVCEGGSVLSLAMAYNDISADAAVDWLGQFISSEDLISTEGFMDEIEAMLRDHVREQAVMPWFNEKVIEKWADRVWPEWLSQRRISAAVARRYKLGYDPEAERITSRGTYTGPGIIFPHWYKGKLVGWQTRWLEPEESRPDWVPKYTNTTDFPKTETVYNLDGAVQSQLPVVVAESVPTALMFVSIGQPAVATFGASVKEEQMRLLRRFQQGVILVGDNDKPGRKFVTQVGSYLDRYVPVMVAPFVGKEGSGNDPADIDDDPRVVLDQAVDLGVYLEEVHENRED